MSLLWESADSARALSSCLLGSCSASSALVSGGAGVGPGANPVPAPPMLGNSGSPDAPSSLSSSAATRGPTAAAPASAASRDTGAAGSGVPGTGSPDVASVAKSSWAWCSKRRCKVCTKIWPCLPTCQDSRSAARLRSTLKTVEEMPTPTKTTKRVGTNWNFSLQRSGNVLAAQTPVMTRKAVAATICKCMALDVAMLTLLSRSWAQLSSNGDDPGNVCRMRSAEKLSK
mmetsp:Transcript_25155/g.79239  ORF Transcript_25155/g.79239 Transcript_25155/m.79239 type:complete len:229 (+) Transcript_25155:127-813(+)